MTTDTFPKGATRPPTIDGATVRINGFAKGSGMIAPDMATMLAYVFTDAALPAAVLQPLLSAATDRLVQLRSPSTATPRPATRCCCARRGRRGMRRSTSADDPRLGDFRRALDAVMLDLAQQVVRDGEGAEKFVTIEVSGAETTRRRAGSASSIGNSPLVKTAIAGDDANWGRIVMAVGKAGEKADRDRLSISVGGVEIAVAGRAGAGLRRGPGRRAHEGPRDRDRRSISASAPAARRCGPAT